MKKMYLLSLACYGCLLSHSQRIGINTTAPLATFHISGNSTSDVLRLERPVLPTLSFYEGSQEAGTLVASYGNFVNLYSTNGFIGMYPNNTFNTAFTGDGNMGIGIQLPSAPLHIYRNADVWHSFIGGATGRLQIGGQTANGAVIQSYNPTTNVVRDLYLQRDGGFVGIGTTSPLAKLHTYSASNGVTPNLMVEESSTGFTRQMFKNANGKSFTLASYSGGTAAPDVLNIYSEKNSSNLLALSSDNRQNVKLSGAVVMGNILTVTNNSNFFGDLNLDGLAVVRFTGNAGTTISGIANGVEGRVIYIEYDGNNHMTLLDNSTTSAAGNRFFLPDAVSLEIYNQHAVMLMYLGGAWRVMSKS